MKISFNLVLLIVMATTVIFGCSKSAENSAVEPSKDFTGIAKSVESNRYMWGYWLVEIDFETLSAEVVPVRNLEGHFNVLKFLEQEPCFNCFKLAGIIPNPDGTFNVNVQMKHPFPGLAQYTGFDVRGIAMFNGSREFPASGLRMSDSSLGDAEILNADGYTTMYNPLTAGYGLEGYVKGNYADIFPPNSTLNAYKRFISDHPLNVRNAFYCYDTVIAVYRLIKPEPPTPLVFGYAIDASWVLPSKTPVIDPMTDFPPEANCPEPWKIQEKLVLNQLFGGGGSVSMHIDVYDRGGAESHFTPRLECPDLFDGTIEATLIDENIEYARYEMTIPNLKKASQDEYVCLISVEDKTNNPDEKPWMDVTAYRVFTITPWSGEVMWAKRAGGPSPDFVYGSTTLYDNSAVITGIFFQTITFGEGEPNETQLVTAYAQDIFVARYNHDGTLGWAKRAGGISFDDGFTITALSDNSTIVAGHFYETATFGLGETNETVLQSAGSSDIFVARYSP